jgi:hypothetical protein
MTLDNILASLDKKLSSCKECVLCLTTNQLPNLLLLLPPKKRRKLSVSQVVTKTVLGSTKKPASLWGGNVVREHVGMLMRTVVHAKGFSISAWDEHFLCVHAGETRTIAG